MDSAKKLLLLLFILLITGQTQVIEGQSYKERVYQSFISGDIYTWAIVLKDMENEYNRCKDISLLYEIAIAQYGYLGFAITRDEKDLARETLMKAEQNVEILLKKNPRWPEVLALRGALYGLNIALDPIKTVTYGKRAFYGNEDAMKYGKSNAQVWMEKGNFEHYKPIIFGRDLDLAINAYRKSLDLYEGERAGIEHNWLYLNTMLNLARAYIEADQITKADQTYQRLLQLEPGLKWLKEKEYPRFLKEHSVSPS